MLHYLKILRQRVTCFFLSKFYLSGFTVWSHLHIIFIKLTVLPAFCRLLDFEFKYNCVMLCYTLIELSFGFIVEVELFLRMRTKIAMISRFSPFYTMMIL